MMSVEMQGLDIDALKVSYTTVQHSMAGRCCRDGTNDDVYSSCIYLVLSDQSGHDYGICSILERLYLDNVSS